MSETFSGKQSSMDDVPITWCSNGTAVRVADILHVPPDRFKKTCVDLCARDGRLVALCSLPPRGVDTRERELLAVIAADAGGRIGLVRMPVPPGGVYEALSRDLPQAQAFERELFEDEGILPEGHPWLKPLRRHARVDNGAAPYPFLQVDGPGIHEVAVGPVHAGIIEPGHFRFQCYGETVLHLEIQLGYQHRGAEALLLRSSAARRLVIAESLAGDSAVGHGLAYCGAVEALASANVPLYAQIVRGVALELERAANHAGDLGALANDIGYAPGAAWFGRLRGEFLNILMDLSGNRFGRSLLKPGGVRFGVSSEQRKDFLARLARAGDELKDGADALFDAPSVSSRFENTGVLTRDACRALGLVGPVARASGCDRDVRRDHPFGIFRFAHIPVSLVESGDVLARALVRRLETQRSLTFLSEQLVEMREETLSETASDRKPDSVVVSMVEGWRGEIAHVAVTSADGGLAAYRVFDPSFHNWLGLAVAMRANRISDFPLCNKSFNLSYAGHDL
jgi:Ni,Fe-hydrogenase III large subunit